MSKISRLFKTFFSKRGLLFFVGNIVFFAVSAVQLYAGGFLLQESGQLDSITTYDYVLPAISSGANLVTLAAFLLTGFFAYGKSKTKMFRFPIAYSFSAIIGSFFANFFTALGSTPVLESFFVNLDVTEINSLPVMLLRVISLWIFFVYFEMSDTEDYDDYYTYDPYGRPGGMTLREKILNNKLSTLWIVLIVSEGAGLVNWLLRSGLVALMVFVPAENYWLSYYIYVVTDIVNFALLILLSMYFVRKLHLAVKLSGLVFLVSNFIGCFSFIFNSITNVFAQAGDHLLNSIFSAIFVYIAAAIIGVIRLTVLILLCFGLKKATEKNYD